MASQLRIVLIVALVLVSTRAHGEARRRYGGDVTTSLPSEPVEIDPLQAISPTDSALARLLFDGLYRLSRNGQVIPHLAAALPDDSEPMAVKIPLRTGVTFSDGSLLTPNDVIASLNRLRSGGRRDLLPHVERIEAEGDVLVFVLNKVDTRLARRLTAVQASITRGGRAPTWRTVGGTGAFTVSARRGPGREVVLRANDGHFAGRPYVDSLTLRWFVKENEEARAFERGTAHISLAGAVAFAGHRPKYRAFEAVSDGLRLAFLGVGDKQKLLEEVEFRQFLSTALDRDGLAQQGHTANYQPAKSLYPQEDVSGRPDSKRAGVLLSSLNVTAPIQLELLINETRPDDAKLAARVAADLYPFGVRVKIRTVGAGTFETAVRAGAYDLCIGSLELPSLLELEQSMAVFQIFQGRSGLAGRSRRYIDRLFARELPLVPLLHSKTIGHFRSDVHGVAYDSSGRLELENLHFFGQPERN